MLTIVRYATGRRADGLIVGMDGDCLRIIFHDSNETAELNRVYDQWFSENGEAVEIESLIPVGFGTYFLEQSSNTRRWKSGLRTATAGAVA